MPLSRKIDKTTFDSLNETLKEQYAERDGNYFLDVEDAKELSNAYERQKETNQTLKSELETLRTELQNIRSDAENAKAEKNRKTKDYDALEADYNRKLQEKDTGYKTQEQKYKDTIQKMLVDNKALELATEAFGENAEIMLPHIKSRLQADFDGDMPTTRVLDKNGQPSANTLDELKKEFVDNPRFAPIVVGSRASGGNASGSSANGNAGNKKPSEMTTEERTHLWKTNPTEFARLFPQAAV